MRIFFFALFYIAPRDTCNKQSSAVRPNDLCCIINTAQYKSTRQRAAQTYFRDLNFENKILQFIRFVMKGFSVKIFNIIKEFLETQHVVSDTPSSTGVISMFYNAVANSKSDGQQLRVYIDFDIEIDVHQEPMVDSELSCEGDIYVIMGSEVWNIAKDSNIWLYRLEKYLKTYISELEQTRVSASNASYEARGRAIKFYWK